MAHLNLGLHRRPRISCPVPHHEVLRSAEEAFRRAWRPARAAAYPGSMAATTDTLQAGYRALTAGAGLLDRSELGKLALTGGQAAELLNGQVSNDVEALVPGAGCYATLLTTKGKMLGDLRVLRTDDELLLV